MTAVGFLLVVSAVACSHNSSSSSTTPSPSITTQTFSGTVGVRGLDTNVFTVVQTGEVDVTLTSTTPGSITMGVGLGTGGASSCTLLPGGSVNTQAGSSPQLTGELTPGPLCVQVYDLGTDTAPVAYTLTVAHP